LSARNHAAGCDRHRPVPIDRIRDRRREVDGRRRRLAVLEHLRAHDGRGGAPRRGGGGAGLRRQFGRAGGGGGWFELGGAGGVGG
jgi:hypothetical protein